MIDKEENKSFYNRISRYVVLLTQATRDATAPTTESVFDAPGDFGGLTLEE